MDPISSESRNAAELLGLCLLALLLASAVGLCPWPGQALFNATALGHGKDLFLVFHGYALVLAVLFWGSKPEPKHQLFVLCTWLLGTVGAIFGFGGELELSWTEENKFPWPLFLATTLAIPAFWVQLWRIGLAWRSDNAFDIRLRWLTLLSLLFMVVPQAALSLTVALHPYTFDAFALHWDRAAGLVFAPSLVVFIDQQPLLSRTVHMAYGMTPLGFLSLALLHLRGRPAHLASGLLVWVGMTTLAFLAYHVLPVTGPRYVFGSGDFAQALRSTTPPPLDLLLVGNFPRNGMPSMHFGWMLATTILWLQSGTRMWSRWFFVAMTTATAIATIYTGEHYVVDLIVAVPFVLASIALCTTGVPWASGARRGVVVLGFTCWLAWVLLLRLAITYFIESPWLCQALLLATALVVLQQIRWMRRFRADARELPRKAAVEFLTLDAQRSQRAFGIMFFVSGAAALVYQVLFAKELALVFGSTATATFTVLATFLGGMAIGSLVGGSLASRVKQPLATYAFVEVGIALYCAITPQLFEAVQSLYVTWATGIDPDKPILLTLRVALGAVVLLVPTVLMGTTLPLLAHALGAQAGRMGSRVAWLYFANTAGAALGALTTAYFIIPLLGVRSTTLTAALLNLLVALGALELNKRAAHSLASDPHRGASFIAEVPSPWPTRVTNMALVTLGVGGLLSLGLEVTYVHLLSIVAGNSVYAFGLMLATFLLGLSLGGEAARRLLLRFRDYTPLALALSLLGLGTAVALGMALWNSIPEYFASYANFGLVRTFSSREAVRGLVCALVMVPPTFFIGAAYVLAMEIVTSATGKPKAALLGVAAAVNTAGNITGVLLFGFVLLPAWGGLATARWVAFSAVVLGGALLHVSGRAVWRRGLLPMGVALASVMASLSLELNYASLSSGANVYFSGQTWGQVIDHAESIDGGLSTVTRQQTSGTPVLTLLTNGKFQGNDAPKGEVQAQIGFALASLLHQEHRDSALVIGYGTGSTSRVFHDAGFAHLDIAELSADIVHLADKHFESINRRVSQAKGVKLHVTDGRNLLLLSERKYDVISIEITSIWFAGAASLYNQDFYQLARSKMSSRGVLQQWLQLHHLSQLDVLTIIASMRSQFKFVSLYVMGSQGILVATNDDARATASPQAMAAISTNPQLADIRRIAARDVQSLANDRLLDAQGIDRFITDIGVWAEMWQSTDDNLQLEYSTPRANVNDADKSFTANIAMLTKFR